MFIQNTNISEENNSNISQQNKDEDSKKSHNIFISLIVCILVIAVVSWVIQLSTNKDNSDTPTLITRKATINDITINSNENNIISIEMTITPKYDIDDLEITVNYYNSSNVLLKTITKNIGNVKKDGKYTEQVYITDFSLSQILELSYCKYKVTGGTVSYFA